MKIIAMTLWLASVIGWSYNAYKAFTSTSHSEGRRYGDNMIMWCIAVIALWLLMLLS